MASSANICFNCIPLRRRTIPCQSVFSHCGSWREIHLNRNQATARHASPVESGRSAQISMGVSAMGIFKSELGANADPRKVTDRRTKEQKRRYDCRVRPDRRLNNISVEWIPFSEVTSHPTIREALSNRRNKKKATGTQRKEQSAVAIYKNKLNVLVDVRKVTERRTQEKKLSYDRRVQPDRRLSNIVVKWIPYS